MDGIWIEAFKGVDWGMMIVITGIAYAMERSSRVPEIVTLFLPLVMGGIWGYLEATERGWGTGAQVYKGVVMNGGAAIIVAKVAHTIGVEQIIGSIASRFGFGQDVKK